MESEKNPRNCDDDWSGWGEYMDAKRRKLADQFKDISTINAKSKIFDGISIFVNGYTEPSATVLKRLMSDHGGQFHLYQCSRTTHYIATNLAQSKIDQLKPGQKIVHPSWITESIKAGCLLSDSNYQLYKSKTNSGSLDAFVGGGGFTNSEGLEICDDLVPSNEEEMEPSNPANQLQSCQPSTSANVSVPTSTVSSKSVPKTTDSNFLTDFYANSRLHFISTLAQDMKDFVYLHRKRHSQGQLSSHPKLVHWTASACRNLDRPHMGWNYNEKAFAHIDMDCFFVSVCLRTRPELKGKPVVVTHSRGKGPARSSSSDNFKSYAEIASCSYEARSFGVRNGMLFGAATQLCDSLIPVSYDFDGYNEVAKKFYEIVLRFTSDVEAVSCDEMYVELTATCCNYRIPPLELIKLIRDEVSTETGCPVSAGIGPNMMLARMATKKAKPNGQLEIHTIDAVSYMSQQEVSELPGVGYVTSEKLESLSVKTCSDLLKCPISVLKREIGAKLAEQLCNYAKGVDIRELTFSRSRKSVSCDINYGIRFSKEEEVLTFLKHLSSEISRRLRNACLLGSHITLKLLIRAAGAPVETKKYLGCGVCDSFTKSLNLPKPTSEPMAIAEAASELFRRIKPIVVDVRGVGITITKLSEEHSGASNSPEGTTSSLPSLFSKAKESKRKMTGSRSKEHITDKKGIQSSAHETLDDPACISFVPESPTSHSSSCSETLIAYERLTKNMPYPTEITAGVASNSTAKSISARQGPPLLELIDKSRPHLCGARDLDDVLDTIKRWIDTEQEPTDIEETLLVQYLTQLIDGWFIHVVPVIFRNIKRYAVEKESSAWSDLWLRIIDPVQAKAVEVFDAPLRL